MAVGNGLLLRILALISLVIAALCVMPTVKPEVLEVIALNDPDVDSMLPKRAPPNNQKEHNVIGHSEPEVNSVPPKRASPNKKREDKVMGGGLVKKTTRVKAAPSTGPSITEPLAATEIPRAKTTWLDISWMEGFSSKVRPVATTRSSPAPDATALADVASVAKAASLSTAPENREEALERLKETGQILLPQIVALMKTNADVDPAAAKEACESMLTMYQITSLFTNEFENNDNEFGTALKGIFDNIEVFEDAFEEEDKDRKAPYWVWKKNVDDFLQSDLVSCPENIGAKLSTPAKPS